MGFRDYVAVKKDGKDIKRKQAMTGEKAKNQHGALKQSTKNNHRCDKKVLFGNIICNML